MTNIINEGDIVPKMALILNSTNTDYKFVDKQAVGVPGGTMEIIIDGVVFTTKIDENGKWSFDPTLPSTKPVWAGGPWAEGEHVIQLRSIDQADNPSPPTLYILNIDKTPPAAPEIWRVVDNTGNEKGNLTPGDTSDEHKPVISGVAEPESIVYLYDNNGTTPIASVRADKMGAWTITPDLQDGDHSLTVTSEDATKNTSVKSTAFNLTTSGGNVIFAEKESSEASAGEETAGSVGTFVEPEAGKSAPTGRTYREKGTFSPSGKTEPFFKVEVAIDDVSYTFNADANGEWRFNGFPELPDGTYVYQVRYCDLADNWGDPAQLIIVVDTAAPEKPQIMRVIDNEGTDNWLSSKQYSNDKTPTLSGVAQPGSVLFIYDADSQTPIGSLTVGADGRWTFTTPDLGEDEAHVLYVAYKDRFGHMSPPSDNFVINLDTSVPSTPTLGMVWDNEGTVTGQVESGKATDDTTPTLSGTGDAGSIIRIWDGATLIASTVVNNQGRWELELPELEEGTHDLRVDAQAKGGNVSPGQTDSFELIIDTKMLPPVQIGEVVANNGPVEISLGSGDATNDTTPVLRGTGSDGEIIHIYDNDKEIGSVKVSNGKWEFEVPEIEKLTEGPHELVVQVEDPNTGKRSGDSDPVSLVVDTTKPEKPSEPTIIDHEGDTTGVIGAGDAIDDNRPEFEGKDAEKDATVEIVIRDENGKEQVIGEGVVDENGNWTVRPTDPIPDGEYEVIVKITDPAGNTSEPSDPVKVIIDTQVPAELTAWELIDDVGVITGPIKNGDVTDDTKPTLSGAGVDGTEIIIFKNDVELARVPVSGGKWEYELSALGEGSYDIKVQPVSKSGVKGPISDPISFEVDTSAPTTGTFDSVKCDYKVDKNTGLPIEEDVGKYVKDNTLIMQGTGADGDVVVIYGDKAHTLVLGSTTVQNGVWRYDTETLEDKEYIFNVGIRDAAGNEYTLGKEFEVTVDTTPPPRPDPVLDSFMDLNEDLMSMSLNDIMAHSNDSLFIDNGKTQMLISEKAGQDLTLEDILPKGEDVNNWSQANGTITVAGVEYNVYQNNGGEAEVLVPQHLMQEQH